MEPHDHHHHHSNFTEQKNITFAFWVNLTFAIIELFGGLFTNSVALLSNSLHDLGDSLSLGLAYYFHKKSTQKSDGLFSFGYKRFALVGALINAFILIIGCVFIMTEAFERIKKPESPNAQGLLGFAALGLLFNLVAFLRLKKGTSVSENIISLHFLEDILGWVAVVIGSVVMIVVDLPIIDPLLSVCIMGFIVFNLYKSLKHIIRIILQGTPADIDLDKIKKAIVSTSSQVMDIHDTHVWSMDGAYNVMSFHLVLKAGTSLPEINTIKKNIKHMLEHLHINHVTIETETEDESCQLKLHSH